MSPTMSLVLALAGCGGPPSGDGQDSLPQADTTATDTATTVSAAPTDPELAPCDTGFPEGPIAPVANGTRWHAVGTGELLGSEIAVADHDGDGLAEILIGAPYSYVGSPSLGRAGAWLLADGAQEGAIDLAAASSYVSRNIGWSDGIALLPDSVVVTGSPDGDPYAMALAFDAADPGRLDPSRATSRFLGAPLDEALGIADMIGDQTPDLVLRSMWGPTGNRDGVLYIFSGLPIGDVQVDSASIIITGGIGERMGTSLAAADVDGDGSVELISGSIEDVGPGTVNLFDDPPSGSTSSLDYPVSLEGEPTGYDAGVTVAGGDLNGDGYGDIVTGDPIIDCGAGRAYLELGPFTGRRYLADADVIVHALGDHDVLGFATTVGDYDGDDQLDWAIGIPRATPEQPPGRVAIFRGPIAPGALDESLADAVLGGPQAGDRFGMALASGDVDGDGIDDLVIGAPEDSTWYPSGGSVTLVLGRGL